MTQEKRYDHYSFLTYNKCKLQKIKSFLPKKEKSLFLDIGCGNGHFNDFIHEFRYSYHGIDISEKQLKEAQERGLDVKRHDLTKRWPYKEGTFDVVLASEIIEHIFDTDFFLLECKRVLKEGGTLIVSTPNICSLGGRIRCLLGKRPPAIDCRAKHYTPGHIRAFSHHDLKTLFKENGFKTTAFTGDDFYLPFITQNTPFLGKICYLLSNLFPTFSPGLIFKCKKI